VKKIIAAVVVTAALGTAAFAAGSVPVSVGAGGFGGFGTLFKGSGSITEQGFPISIEETLSYTPIGGYIFLDAKYVEASFGFWGGNSEIKGKMSYMGESQSESVDGDVSGLYLGILGKYPIATKGKLTWFPMLGLQFDFVNKLMDETEDASDANSTYLSLGLGLVYPINDKVFFRADATFGLRVFQNQLEKDIKDEMGIDPDLGTRFGVNLGVGYRL
jgi:hypothetical protein